MSKIIFHLEDVKFKLLSRNALKSWIREVIQTEGKQAGDISFILCSDEYLLDINRRYLSHDYYTDVITFDYSDGRIVSGDIYISIDRVKDNATIYKVKTIEEMKRVMIHGVLHLIGYKDDSENSKSKMRYLETMYIAHFNKKN